MVVALKTTVIEGIVGMVGHGYGVVVISHHVDIHLDRHTTTPVGLFTPTIMKSFIVGVDEINVNVTTTKDILYHVGEDRIQDIP